MNDETPSASGRGRLIESLWRDAKREADQCIARAKTEARKLLEDTALFREREMAQSSEKAEREAKPHVAMILNQARGRARQILLEGRYSFLNSCFDEVLGLITGNNALQERVRSSFSPLLEQALSALGNQDSVEILLNPVDMEKARSVLDGTGTAFDLVTDENIRGGAMLKGNCGSLVADSTLETRMSVLRKRPPIDLLQMIHPGEDR